MSSADRYRRAKDDAKNQGGEIKHEFTLIKGFTYVSFEPHRVLFKLTGT